MNKLKTIILFLTILLAFDTAFSGDVAEKVFSVTEDIKVEIFEKNYFHDQLINNTEAWEVYKHHGQIKEFGETRPALIVEYINGADVA